MKRGESEKDFAERCRRLIVEYWQERCKFTPDVRIVSVDGDPYAIRSNIGPYLPARREI